MRVSFEFPEKGIAVKGIVLIAVLAVVAILFYPPNNNGLPFFAISQSEEKETDDASQAIEEIPLPEEKVRQPAVAGKFYEGNAERLAETVNGYLALAEEASLPKVKGLVVPHAGYVFSGMVAASGFKQLSNKENSYKTVFLIGASHSKMFDGASIPDFTHYKTPLGLVKVSTKAEKLREESLIVSVPEAHLAEHSLEVQLPFLQTVLPNVEIVPIVTGNIDPEQLAVVLADYLDEETLVIASSDLSHYYSYQEALQLDKKCVEAIPGLDFGEMQHCEACGKIPVLTLMHLSQKMGWQGRALDYRNSGDTFGEKSSVVGYFSAAFFEGQSLSEGEERILLLLARDTLERQLSGQPLPEIDEEMLSEKLKQVQGCFVTLNKQSKLRGCIGHILPQEKLYQCVRENAVAAALFDNRFEPVSIEELPGLEVEISVLTVPELLSYSSLQELIEGLRPEVDGVVMDFEGKISTFLPQVWQQIPDREEFLSQLCLKQGSESDCWTMPETKIYTYQALVFHEG